MDKKILVALDNSDYAIKVMHQAVELADLYKCTLYGVSVIDNSYFSTGDQSDSYSDNAESFWTTTFQHVLDECSKLAEQKDIYFQQNMINGNPAEEIIKYAADYDFDIIVLGHLGKSAASGFGIGSVAQKVAAYAKCSVLIVK